MSCASRAAIDAIEGAGGTITSVHFNRLALQALCKPFKFSVLPRRARPPPKLVEFYMDQTQCGYLSPEIQVRNLRMFGAVTSEPRLREEHGYFMRAKWEQTKQMAAAREEAAETVPGEVSGVGDDKSTGAEEV